jgi:hypothetical protein
LKENQKHSQLTRVREKICSNPSDWLTASLLPSASRKLSLPCTGDADSQAQRASLNLGSQPPASHALATAMRLLYAIAMGFRKEHQLQENEVRGHTG